MIPNVVHLNPITFTAGALSGGGLRSLDLMGRAPFPKNVGISIRVRGNAVAPGSNKTATVYYALAPSPDLSVGELANASATQVLNLPSTASGNQDYTLPTVLPSQRYLYVWFDHDALGAGAELTVTPVINC